MVSLSRCISMCPAGPTCLTLNAQLPTSSLLCGAVDIPPAAAASPTPSFLAGVSASATPHLVGRQAAAGQVTPPSPKAHPTALPKAGATTSAAAAAGAGEGGGGVPALPALSLAAVLLGFGSRQLEAAFQAHKAQHLLPRDMFNLWALAGQAAFFYYANWRFACTMHDEPLAWQMVWVAPLIHLPALLAPALVFACARRLYMRHRGLVWALSQLAGGCAALLLMHFVAMPLLWQRLSHMLIKRRLPQVLMLYVLEPAVTQLSPWQQLIACVGEVLTSRAMSFMSVQGDFPLAAHAAFAAGALAITCVLEWRMRRGWLRRLQQH